jgi:hypothetical protein
MWWHKPCDCPPLPVIATTTITDAAGNVRAVREGQFFVRPHRHHDREHHEHRHGQHERDR